MRVFSEMIITCVRCHTEFSSDHTHTHACPKCHLVFSADDLGEETPAVVSSSDRWPHNQQAHQLYEETGARCSYHPDIDATDNCSVCGKPVCYACAVETSHGCLCERCVDASAAAPADEYPTRRGGAPQKGEAPGAGGEPGRTPKPASIIPWEQRRQIGRQKALFATWRAAILRPSKIFGNVGSGRGYLGPMLYGTFWLLFGLAGGLMWRLSIHILPKALMFIYGESIEVRLPFSLANTTFAIAVAVVPLVVMLLLLAMCLGFHLFVVAAIRNNSGFKTTLRVICYSAGAFGFYFVPAAGGLLAGVSQLIMVTIGFKQAHRTSLPRAVAAAFIPCALHLVAGLIFAAWAVEGSRLEAANLLAWLLPPSA